MSPIPRPVAAVPRFVVRGWSMGGWGGGVGGTGAGEQGQFGAAPPRRYSRVPVGPRKPSFCLKRPQRLMRRLGRALTGQTVQTTRVGAAHSGREGNQTSRIPYSSPLSSGFLLSHPTGLVRLNLSPGACLGLGLDLDLIWILTGTCVLFASVHCVISRPVLAGLGETLMTAFLWRSARNASERLHPHHTHTTHVHQPRCSRAQTVWTAGHLLERGTSVSDSKGSSNPNAAAGQCTSVPDATAPRSNSVALNTKMVCLPPPSYMHLISQAHPRLCSSRSVCCCRLLLMRTPLVAGAACATDRRRGGFVNNSTQITDRLSCSTHTAPSTTGNLQCRPVEFSGVVERHLMSRLSSIIKSASDRGDQDSLRIGPIVNGNMGPPGQSQRTCPSTVWEEGARAEI